MGWQVSGSGGWSRWLSSRWICILVESKAHEDALRTYETDKYEVVPCEILMREERVMGCTFRFVGTDALSSENLNADTGRGVLS
jgi:hypothetical protein